MLISLHIHGSIILLRVFVIYDCLGKGHLTAICTATFGCKQEFVLLIWSMFMDCCANLSKCLLEEQLFEVVLPGGDSVVSDLGRGSWSLLWGVCPALAPQDSRDREVWRGARGGCRGEEGSGGKAEDRRDWNKHQTKHQHNDTLKLSQRLSSDLSSALTFFYLSGCLKLNWKQKQTNKPYPKPEVN